MDYLNKNKEIMNNNESYQENKSFFLNFMLAALDSEDEVSICVLATLVQFIKILRGKITAIANKNDGHIDTIQVIDSEIEALRSCILDLNNCKEFIIKGVKKQ